MNRKLVLLLLVGFLLGCGQKGPLYLPEDKDPATPEAEQPLEVGNKARPAKVTENQRAEIQPQ